MQFKNIKKSKVKANTSEKINTSLKKNEIKEIVEETVEEVLKEQTKQTEKSKTNDEVANTAEKHNESDDSKEVKMSDVNIESSSDAVPDTADTADSVSDTKNTDTEKDTLEISKNTVTPVLEGISNETSDKEASSQTDKSDEVSSSSVTPVTASAFSTPQPPTENVTKTVQTNKMSALRIFVIFTLLGILAGAGLWFVAFHNMFSVKLPTVPGLSSVTSPTPTTAPTVALSPTQNPGDISKYSISVLNGSGIAGAASQAKSDLAQAGFTVTTTGNATNSNFTDTIIAAKSSVDSSALQKLSETLAQKYTVSSHVLTLDNAQTADIVVTIGSSTK